MLVTLGLGLGCFCFCWKKELWAAIPTTQRKSFESVSSVTAAYAAQQFLIDREELQLDEVS